MIDYLVAEDTEGIRVRQDEQGRRFGYWLYLFLR